MPPSNPPRSRASMVSASSSPTTLSYLFPIDTPKVNALTVAGSTVIVATGASLETFSGDTGEPQSAVDETDGFEFTCLTCEFFSFGGERSSWVWSIVRDFPA